MFDRHHLLANWRSQPLPDPDALFLMERSSRDFRMFGEDWLDFGRGARADFLGPLHFWISAYFATSIYEQPVLPADINDEEAAVIESALCEPISREEFLRILDDYAGNLFEPLPAFMRKLDGWRGGLRQYNDWNWVEVVAELNEGYLYFSWGTTA